MTDKRLFVGIDTSNYTTSAAVCDGEGRVLLNQKIPLPVKAGERGLRQSDAVFHHVKGLPEAADALRRLLLDEALAGYTIAAVGYSAAPRDSEGSYMPCFLSGKAAAEMASALLGVPAYGFSHQAGHVMAALASACDNSGLDRRERMASPFLAFHVSGGTTDLLLCRPGKERLFEIEGVGGTRDINAGQAIDRCGVLMGLSFPCGAAMDLAALCFEGKVRRDKLAVDGLTCNLSGLENKSAALYRETGSVEVTSAYVLDFVGRTLEKMTLNAWEVYGKLPVIYSGGVMSSAYIKKRLSVYGLFASPAFSSDNAAGIALLAREKYLSGRSSWIN